MQALILKGDSRAIDLNLVLVIESPISATSRRSKLFFKYCIASIISRNNSINLPSKKLYETFPEYCNMIFARNKFEFEIICKLAREKSLLESKSKEKRKVI